MSKNVKVLFGKQLRKVRMAKGISQEELAFRSGLHRTYVSSVERGERNISIVNIQKLSEALGVDISNLMP
ncbi:MAG: helix-turn-helix domain-containing protein [Eubacteriaceae bacterium]|jgi:transcriptional regulator with XRE-family HTH domain|nr:helix-turn-helix domain-containing protein [Acholeplasmataceae bacterium]